MAVVALLVWYDRGACEWEMIFEPNGRLLREHSWVQKRFEGDDNAEIQVWSEARWTWETRPLRDVRIDTDHHHEAMCVRTLPPHHCSGLGRELDRVQTDITKGKMGEIPMKDLRAIPDSKYTPLRVAVWGQGEEGVVMFMFDYPHNNVLLWMEQAPLADAIFNGTPRHGFEWWDARKSMWRWNAADNDALCVPNGFDLMLIRHQSNTRCANFGRLVSETEEMVRQGKAIRPPPAEKVRKAISSSSNNSKRRRDSGADARTKKVKARPSGAVEEMGASKSSDEDGETVVG